MNELKFSFIDVDEWWQVERFEMRSHQSSPDNDVRKNIAKIWKPTNDELYLSVFFLLS